MCVCVCVCLSGCKRASAVCVCMCVNARSLARARAFIHKREIARCFGYESGCCGVCGGRGGGQVRNIE